MNYFLIFIMLCLAIGTFIWFNRMIRKAQLPRLEMKYDSVFISEKDINHIWNNMLSDESQMGFKGAIGYDYEAPVYFDEDRVDFSLLNHPIEMIKVLENHEGIVLMQPAYAIQMKINQLMGYNDEQINDLAFEAEIDLQSYIEDKDEYENWNANEDIQELMEILFKRMKAKNVEYLLPLNEIIKFWKMRSIINREAI